MSRAYSDFEYFRGNSNRLAVFLALTNMQEHPQE